MRYSIRMSTHGRITIPKAIRDELGLRGGMTLEWSEGPDGIVGQIVSIGDDKR